MLILKRRVSGITILLMAFCCSGTAEAKGSGECAMHNLSRDLHAIELLPPSNNRFERLSDLGVYLRQSGNDCITDDDINTLSRLVRDPDDSIRFVAALIVGNIGSRARRVVPVLMTSLNERPCSTGSLSSSVAIRIALQKIGDTSEKPRCE